MRNTFFYLVLLISLAPHKTWSHGRNNNFYEHARVYKTMNHTSPSMAWSQIRRGEMETAENKANQGFSRHYFWVHFEIASKKEKAILEVSNPFIDSLQLFQVVEGKPRLIGEAGDRMPFDKRPLSHIQPAFQLGASDDSPGVKHYLLMVDKRNASVSIPIHIWGQSEFDKHTHRRDITNGLILGIISIVGLLSLLAYFVLGQKLFMYYGIYALLMAFYLFISLGYAFAYIYPKSDVYNNYSRLIFFIFTALAAVKFTRVFFRSMQFFPTIDQLLKWTSRTLIFIFGLWLVFSSWFLGHSALVINVLYALFFLILIGFVSLIISGYKKGYDQTGIYAFAFFAIMLSSLAYIFIEYGWISADFLPTHPMVLGSGLEVIILSAAMMKKLSGLRSRQDKLEQTLESQEQQLREVIQSFEKTTQAEKQEEKEKPNNAASGFGFLLMKGGQKIDFEDLYCIESKGHYNVYFLEKDSVQQRETVNSAIQRLPRPPFLQVHRSFIVNMQKVKMVASQELVLMNGRSIPVSRKFKPLLKEQGFQ